MKKLFSAILAIAMAVTFVVARTPSVVMAENLSGTYIIKSAYNSYLIDPTTMDTSAQVTTQSVNPHLVQSWQFIQQSDGAYHIKSMANNMYLAVDVNTPSGYDRVILSTQSATTNDARSWYISLISGVYRIASKTNSSYVIGPEINSAPSADGELFLIPYRADGYNYELWSLIPITHSLSFDVDYDVAYKNRYSSTYSTRIETCLELLKSRMMFAGIEITSTSPEQISTYATTGGCATGSSYSSMCNCGTTCQNSTLTSLKTYHHTNAYNNLYRITNSSSSLRVVFTGKEMCYATNLAHVPNASNAAIFSFTDESRGVIIIKDFMSDYNHDVMIFARSILQLYGLEDHTAGGLFSNDCIFGANANTTNVRYDCLVCEGCLDKLRQNADEH